MAATPSPVTPDQFKALIPSNTAGACEAFAKAMIGIPTRIWEFFSWLLTADGFINKKALKVQRPGDLILSASSYLEDDDRLLCDGRTLNVSAYPDLAAALGAGGLTFDLPDFSDRFPVGALSPNTGGIYGLRSTGGAAEVVLTVDQMPAHTHTAIADTVVVKDPPDWDINGPGLQAGYSVGGDVFLNNTGGDQPHPNIPPYLAVYIYIAT